MVYAFTCPRKHTYTGSSARDLRKRASEHRYNVRNGRAAPGKHWRQCNLCTEGVLQMKFTLLAHVPDARERRRVEKRYRRRLRGTYGRPI